MQILIGNRKSTQRYSLLVTIVVSAWLLAACGGETEEGITTADESVVTLDAGEDLEVADEIAEDLGA